MIRNLTIFAGLAATGVAQAALLGGVLRENTAGTTTLNNEGVAATVFDMYMQFSEADDILISIGNSDVTTVGNLYQDTFGADFIGGISPAIIGAFPTAEFDSVVGIGGPWFAGSGFGGDVDPDFAFNPNGWVGGWFATPQADGMGGFTFPGTSTFNSNTGVWEVFAGRFSIDGDVLAGGLPVGDAVAEGNLLTGQNAAGDLIFSGELEAFWVEQQGSDAIGNVLQIEAVPAPGAAALFGLAGLTAARRRR
jgi:hypothetical protein